MDDIRRRLDLITAHSTPVGEAETIGAIEFIYLQFRRILELIAFGSLIVNKEAYAQQYANFASHWRAKNLIKGLEEVNPWFYPEPLIESVHEGVLHARPREADHLTKADFIALYDLCGDVLHTPNPFKPAVDYARYGREVGLWKDKIISLLDVHRLRFFGDSDTWHHVRMVGPNGCAEHWVMSLTPPEGPCTQALPGESSEWE